MAKNPFKDFIELYKSKRNLRKIAREAAFQFAQEINSQSPVGIGIKAHTQNIKTIQDFFMQGKPKSAREYTEKIKADPFFLSKKNKKLVKK